MMAVIAALPREVAGLVRGTTPDPQSRREGLFLYRLPYALVVCAGMGATRVTLAVELALREGAHELVSSGLAGGCEPGLAAGSVLRAGTVVDTLSGERFSTLDTGPLLATTSTIAGVREKARLYASYGAALVDMEAATVARLARAHGVAFRAVKAVSDPHDFELTSLERFSTRHGHFRTGAFALHTALRPHRWRHAMRLGAGSQRALRALAAELLSMLEGGSARR